MSNLEQIFNESIEKYVGNNRTLSSFSLDFMIKDDKTGDITYEDLNVLIYNPIYDEFLTEVLNVVNHERGRQIFAKILTQTVKEIEQSKDDD